MPDHTETYNLRIEDEPNPDRDPDSFMFIVKGDVQRTPTSQSTLIAPVGNEYTAVAGFVFGGEQEFVVTGPITNFQLVEYDVNVYIEGVEVDARDVVTTTGGDDVSPSEPGGGDDSPGGDTSDGGLLSNRNLAIIGFGAGIALDAVMRE